MATDRGFSLIEVLVAVLIGVLLVVFVGVLGGNLIRHRANSDSSSAATNIAQKVLEQVVAVKIGDRNPVSCGPCASGPWPWDGGACSTPLCAVTYGPFSVNERVEPAPGGPYQITWTVTDDWPWGQLPDVQSKQIEIVVTHENNPTVESRLQTVLQTTQVGS